MRPREFAEAVGGSIARRVGRAAGRVQEQSMLAADVLESDDEYLVVFDAPGATASDIHVDYADRTVEVRVDRFRKYREDVTVQFPGRGLSLDGEATLPADAVVDADRAHAELRDNGTLYVFLPKAEDARTTTVPVTESGDESAADDGRTDAGNDDTSVDSGADDRRSNDADADGAS